jgi:hypothetical protein
MSLDDAKQIGGVETIPYGTYIYVPNTEWGGIIDGKKFDNTSDVPEITFTGRTWHGILEGAVLQPASGSNYVSTGTNLRTAIYVVLNKCGLTDIFNTTGDDVTITAEYFPRYCSGYSGLCELLKRHGYRLEINKPFKGVPTLAVVKYTTWDSGFDDNFLAFTMSHAKFRTNHLICLGQGELKDRTVIHLYADEDGNISTEQTFKGVEEIAEAYDYSSVEDETELKDSGTKKLQEYQSIDEVDFSLSDEEYKIGDLITASSVEINLQAKAYISKIIVSLTDEDIPAIQYETGEITTEVIR